MEYRIPSDTWNDLLSMVLSWDRTTVLGPGQSGGAANLNETSTVLGKFKLLVTTISMVAVVNHLKSPLELDSTGTLGDTSNVVDPYTGRGIS